MRSLKLTLAFLLTVSYSYCQETLSEYEFLGFSNDLKYMAFETHIPPPVEDMAPSSKILIVDVAANNYATKTMSLTGKPAQEVAPVIAQNKKNSQANFAKFKITPGKNKGQQLPLTMMRDEWQHDVARDTQVFVIDNVKYTLELHSIETGETHESLMLPKYMFELVVKYNSKTQVLQKDKSVPASRGFVTGYSILSAWRSGNKLAVFLEYRNPGFEGYPDRFQMVVTGVLGK